MNTSDFNFVLPDCLIAKNPSAPRDSCSLMVIDRESGIIKHSKFFDISEYLNNGDVLVLNNSKVIPARINFLRENRVFELLLIRKRNNSDWICIGKPGKHLQKGGTFSINSDLSFEVLDKEHSGEMLIRFFSGASDPDTALRAIGAPPFPPYIKDTTASFDDYQTVFAQHEGSVAAPTAGLHFTDRLLDELKAKGVQILFVTLHVGLGTFLPIKTDIVERHKMHGEVFSIDKNTANQLNEAKNDKRRIIAVGTTAVRVLESSYDPVSGFMSGFSETDIFIYPGYKWKCVSGLITNFHLPKSTLLLLVSSFGGKELILSAYKEAIRLKYRFYSFGDAMLIM